MENKWSQYYAAWDWILIMYHVHVMWSRGCKNSNNSLMALCPGLPRWTGTRNVKPIWIVLKQEMVGGSSITQLGHMQVSTSPSTDTRSSTPPLSFLQAGCPSYHPTNSVKALKACKNAVIISTISVKVNSWSTTSLLLTESDSHDNRCCLSYWQS